MTSFDIRRIDLNLLVALDALLTERSVSAAARRLGVTQSAASQSLAKLRRHFDDELLHRVESRYQLTPLAMDLQPRVDEVMQELGSVLARADEFDPSTTEREFVVHVSDYAAFVIGGSIVAFLAEAAPRATVRLAALGPAKDIKDVLRHADGVVLPQSGEPPGAAIELFADEWCCVVDRVLADEAAHWDRAEFLRRGWVAAEVNGNVPGQDFMRRAGVEIDVVARVPVFSAVPYVVAGTPHVGAMHRRLAECLADPAGVSIVPTPWASQAVHVTLFYDRQRAQDPAVRWFLDCVEQIARGLADRGAEI